MNKIAHATDLCCSGQNSGAGALIPVDEAIARSLALARPLSDIEQVPLEEAIGRVLADDLYAPFALPPFDSSAMDGYAVRSSDFVGAGPWRLTVTGRVAAGDDISPMAALATGQACRIFTGAAMAKGADAVIMQEHVKRSGAEIIVHTPVVAGSCVRKQGEDAPPGSLLLERGTLIGAREIGAIASVGLPQVAVRRKVRIALFCTGSELRQPGQSLAPGQIYNSNRYMMLAALHQPWIEVQDKGAVADDPKLLRDALVSASQTADMVVTTGGVSVGDEDHMVAQLLAAGGKIELMKIAMKPGKPLSIGKLKGAVYVGLPGNPVAAFTTWKIIASRIARQISGQASGQISSQNSGQITGGVAGLTWAHCDGEAAAQRVEISQSFTRRPGRQEFRPAKIIGVSASGRPTVRLLDHSFSAKISLICRSDGFAVIPAHSERVTAGDCLEFVRL